MISATHGNGNNATPLTSMPLVASISRAGLLSIVDAIHLGRTPSFNDIPVATARQYVPKAHMLGMTTLMNEVKTGRCSIETFVPGEGAALALSFQQTQLVANIGPGSNARMLIEFINDHFVLEPKQLLSGIVFLGSKLNKSALFTVRDTIDELQISDRLTQLSIPGLDYRVGVSEQGIFHSGSMLAVDHTDLRRAAFNRVAQ